MDSKVVMQTSWPQGLETSAHIQPSKRKKENVVCVVIEEEEEEESERGFHLNAPP